MTPPPMEESQKPALGIRVHLDDGSVECFAQTDNAEASHLWEKIEPLRLFTQSRLIIAGEFSKSVFATAHILRVDFMRECCECWRFPEGYSDIVELSEEQFTNLAHLDQPELKVKRVQPTPPGDLLVSFLKLRSTGSKPLFLMIEFAVKQAIDNHSFMRYLLSKGGFHFRLLEGGIGVVNLAHLAGYTVYPGVAQVPNDSWLAEPVQCASLPSKVISLSYCASLASPSKKLPPEITSSLGSGKGGLE